MQLVRQIHREELADALRYRQARTRVRFVSTFLLALVYLPIVPWPVAIGCLAVLCTWHALEALTIDPSRVATSRHSWPLVWSLVCVAGQSLALGWIGVEVMLRADPLGPAIANSHFVGAVFIGAMASRRSILAFWASVGPSLILLVGSAIYSFVLTERAPLPQGVSLMGAALLIIGVTITFWREHARLSRSEVAAREAAQSASAAKSNFIATVSHELRTPISAIQAGAVELERTLAEPGHRRRAGLILDASGMMRSLLDDLLDLTKVEAGRMGVELIAFDARSLVVDTVRFWQAEARKKGLRLKLHGGKGLPRWIQGDPMRIRQVLNNLLSNALKFTDQGTVELSLAQVDGQLCFCVRDEGIGMSPDQLGRLFMPFGQANASIARTHGGTGLGLALSRDLARLMAGDLVVESALGRGSRFSLSLPLVFAEPPQEDLPEPPSAHDVPALKILVVDDHEINRRAMGILLEAMGLSAAIAVDGVDALKVLDEEPFDVVLMDVHMPRLDGLEVTRRLRSRPGPNRATPVVAVTGASEPQDVARCLDAGMTDCVGKPIDPSELHRALTRLLAPLSPAEVAQRTSR